MKKILLTASAVAMLLVACSKDDNPTPDPVVPDVDIYGDWTGASYEVTGFIDGEAIEEKNTDADEFVKSLNLTFFEGTEAADSIKGTYGEDQNDLLGTYVLNTEKDPNTIEATVKLSEAEDAEFSFDGDVEITDDAIVVTKGVKGEMEFGDQTADSTSTVIKFIRKK